MQFLRAGDELVVLRLDRLGRSHAICWFCELAKIAASGRLGQIQQIYPSGKSAQMSVQPLG